MGREATIVGAADLPFKEESIVRESKILAKTFSPDTGVRHYRTGFTWLVHGKGYDAP